MENASKALIIAAGVLVSMLILGLLVYLWQNVSNYNTEMDDQKKAEQISAFNKEYESYQKQLLRGADVASVVNKVISYNESHVGDDQLKIIYEIEIRKDLKKDNTIFLQAGQTYSNVQDNDKIKNLVEKGEYSNQLTEFKRLYFACSKIEYSSETGRVNKIKFKQLLNEEIFH